MSTEAAIERIIQVTGDLPPMPHIASLVMQKASDPNTTAKELQQTISQDQAVTAHVLRIANSALYSYSRNITSLTDAITMMGFNSIKSLVVTSALKGLFKTLGLTEKLLWEHSLGCASIAKKIARKAKFPKVEEAFLAGLLHDIGKVVLNLKVPDTMTRIVQEVYNTPGITFAELEHESLGFNHAQIGQLIVRKWNFAPEIEEAIGCHHLPERARLLPALCNIVHLANGFCHRLEIGPTRNPDLNLMELSSVGALKLSQQTVDELLEEASDSLAAGTDVFAF